MKKKRVNWIDRIKTALIKSLKSGNFISINIALVSIIQDDDDEEEAFERRVFDVELLAPFSLQTAEIRCYARTFKTNYRVMS